MASAKINRRLFSAQKEQEKGGKKEIRRWWKGGGGGGGGECEKVENCGFPFGAESWRRKENGGPINVME